MRAFLGSFPPIDTRQALAGIGRLLQAQAAEHRVRLTLVKPEAIHLTFRFLGEMNESSIGALRLSLQRALEPQLGPAVTLPISRIGAYPQPSHPRIIWAGPTEEWNRDESGLRLLGLQRTIETEASRLSTTDDDKRWTAHITIARVRDGERIVGKAMSRLESIVTSLPLNFRIDWLQAMSSDLGPSGPSYKELWRLPLARLI